MNESARKQIYEDYREIIKTDSGKRVLGMVMLMYGLKGVNPLSEYQQGRRSAAVQIANTIYEVNPYGVADCLTAYEDFMREHADDERRDDDEYSEYDE